MKKTKKSAKKGFTLIELIVVIAILGILAAVLLPKFTGFTDDARKKTAITEAKTCYTAVATYYAENGVYPTVDKKGELQLSDELKAKIEKIETNGGLTFKDTATKITVTVPANGVIKATDAVKEGETK